MMIEGSGSGSRRPQNMCIRIRIRIRIRNTDSLIRQESMIICMLYFLFLGAYLIVKIVISAPSQFWSVRIRMIPYQNKVLVNMRTFSLRLCFVKFENTFPSCVLKETIFLLHFIRIIVWNRVVDPDPHGSGLFL